MPGSALGVGRVTPEEARELLDEATPGPWRVETDVCECCTYVAAPAAAVCTPDAEDAPLVAAAPELAEIVAGLRVEYAAQVELHGKRHIISDSVDGHWLCGDEYKALQHWHGDHIDAKEHAESWNNHESKRYGATARIVARYVSEPWEVEQ